MTFFEIDIPEVGLELNAMILDVNPSKAILDVSLNSSFIKGSVCMFFQFR